MNHTQDSRSPAFHFVSMLRKILPKDSSMPSEIAAVLNNFEETLAGRITELKPIGNGDFLQLSWMTIAMEQLCLIHKDVENLSVALDHRVSDWKEKWMHTYFEDSAEMLKILNPFISHIHALEEGQRYFICALHYLRKGTQESSAKARSSLDKWIELVGSNNPSLQKCYAVLDAFPQTPYLPKTSNYKEDVLMRAIYGFKVFALFVFSVFATIFSGSVEKTMDVKVANAYLWADAFVNLQASVKAEIMNISSSGNVIVLRELKAVDEGIERVYAILGDGVGGGDEAEGLENAATSILGESTTEQFSRGIALLSKEVDRFFKALLSGRNTLMGRAQHCLFPRGGM